jgi:hypothetical protein
MHTSTLQFIICLQQLLENDNVAKRFEEKLPNWKCFQDFAGCYACILLLLKLCLHANTGIAAHERQGTAAC